MTEEERQQLLLVDLCSRLPYGVKYRRDSWNFEWDQEISVVEVLEDIDKEGYINHTKVYKVSDIEPYLRPMSSMTEKELDKLRNYTGLLYDNLDLASFQNGSYKCLDFYLSEIPADVVIKVFDWLHMHHFDYRGLISMGLALVAPKDMYNNK